MRYIRNFLVLYVAFVLLLAWNFGHSKTRTPYAHLQNITVKVESGNAIGTGVIVTRQVGDVTRSYVWTAGHVVENMLRADGTFSQVAVSWEVRENGQFIEEVKIPAKVIAYSNPVIGEDLALLEILQDDLCALNVSAEFISKDSIPAAGTELVHVGCTLGYYDSVSLGIVSQTDRTLYGIPGEFDQTSVMGYPGSSGGGVYTLDGTCIGLLTRGDGPGLNFIVPVRRMREWAAVRGIEWALDANVPVPTRVLRDPISVE